MAPDPAPAGGDDACWLHLVCDGCGGVVDDPAHHCAGEPSAGAVGSGVVDDRAQPCAEEPAADAVSLHVASTTSGRSEVAAGDERRIAQVE